MKKLFKFCEYVKDIYSLKIIKLMRNLLILMFITVFQVFAEDSYSQKTRLTLNLTDVSVENVLNSIENQSEFFFLCNKKLVDVERKVNIRMENQYIDDILSRVFKGTNVKYVVMDRQIVLSPAEYLEKVIRTAQLIQQETVTGTVTDEEGNPLPGVNIVVKGTIKGTITDANGNYSIEVDDLNSVLTFSFIGYLSQEIFIEGRNIIDATLAIDVFGLEEVVVVGYGIQKKINVTGAISSVSSKELADRPVTSVAEALQGVVPNLQITTTDGGRPGSSLIWQIRGVGSIGGARDNPLILIDGIPGNPSNLNPDDIEDISVLKDASASAIYGSRAPYGAILITTKRGESEKMKVTFNSSLALRVPMKMLNPMGSMDFINYYNESAANIGIAPYFSQDWIDSLQTRIDNPDLPNYCIHRTKPTKKWGWAVGIDQDWWSETYKKMAQAQNYNISASGGSKAVNYYVSLGYLDQEGLYRYGNDSFKRYSGLVNLHTNATKWLELDLRMRFTRRDNDTPNSDDLQFQAYRVWPLQSLRDPHGYWTKPAYPYHIAAEGGRKKTNNDNFNNTLGFVIKPFEGFRLKGDATFNSSNQMYKRNNKILYKYSPLDEIIGTQNGANISYIEKAYTNSKFYTTNFYADYVKQLGTHYLHFLAGYQQEYEHWYNLNGYRDNLIAQDVPSLRTATGENINVVDDESEWSTQGYFGRINYNYKEKYIFEFNSRYDGSSRFPKDYRWGFFPSASIGYNIARESFFAPLLVVIDNMKLRASYGRLGNSNVGNYYSPTISKVQTDYIGASGVFLDYVSAPGFGNYYLTWEKPTTIDVGVDIGMFKNRLQMNFDWYRRETIDMIGPSEPMPKVLGASVPQKNNTEMKGTGWELSLLYKGAVKEFHYQAVINIAHHEEVVTSYYNPEGLLSSYYDGKVLGEIWGYETVGFINDEETLASMADQTLIGTNWGLGDIQYKDIDGDGKITYGSYTLEDHGDMVRIGNQTPDYSYNITLACDYKGFDMRVFFRGLGHTDWWPNSGQGYRSGFTSWVFFGNSNNRWNNATLEEHKDHWTQDNHDAYYPRAMVGVNMGQKNSYVQSRYLQNGAFLRLKNIQFGYTLPEKWSKPYQIRNVRVYVSGENLLTFTKLRIFDPETPGLIYPLQKVFSGGIKATF